MLFSRNDLKVLPKIQIHAVNRVHEDDTWPKPQYFKYGAGVLAQVTTGIGGTVSHDYSIYLPNEKVNHSKPFAPVYTNNNNKKVYIFYLFIIILS